MEVPNLGLLRWRCWEQTFSVAHSQHYHHAPPPSPPTSAPPPPHPNTCLFRFWASEPTDRGSLCVCVSSFLLNKNEMELLFNTPSFVLRHTHLGLPLPIRQNVNSFPVQGHDSLPKLNHSYSPSKPST